MNMYENDNGYKEGNINLMYDSGKKCKESNINLMYDSGKKGKEEPLDLVSMYDMCNDYTSQKEQFKVKHQNRFKAIYTWEIKTKYITETM